MCRWHLDGTTHYVAVDKNLWQSKNNFPDVSGSLLCIFVRHQTGREYDFHFLPPSRSVLKHVITLKDIFSPFINLVYFFVYIRSTMGLDLITPRPPPPPKTSTGQHHHQQKWGEKVMILWWYIMCVMSGSHVALSFFFFSFYIHVCRIFFVTLIVESKNKNNNHITGHSKLCNVFLGFFLYICQIKFHVLFRLSLCVRSSQGLREDREEETK